MKEIIQQLLSARECKKFQHLFGTALFKSKVKKQWSCFGNANTWIQFIHSLTTLCNRYRSSILIDFATPNEWCDFVDFFHYTITQLSVFMPSLSHLLLIHLDDYLLFIVHKDTLLSRINRDYENDFKHYQFIDVSPKLSNPIKCNSRDLHINQLKIILDIVKKEIENSNSNNSKIKSIDCVQLLDESVMNSIYLPIVSGWFCEYPVIYCNSADCKECSLLNQQQQKREWDDNCLSSCDNLIRFVVYLNTLESGFDKELDKVESLHCLTSFTYPLSLVEQQHIDRFKETIESRLNSNDSNGDMIKVWKNYKVESEIVQLASIRL
ncbi:hypothetical protein CYY_003208 [Polysphondylium violaceum]|uniref:Uncharacterized protein n=1 Tax=Polysphondylium violaceum TaxID=133409 RepID=A0A8J4PYI9_9MYCE|nr:hypothetical protein CYY_003208 [Polysphondylium violaceum]